MISSDAAAASVCSVDAISESMEKSITKHHIYSGIQAMKAEC